MKVKRFGKNLMVAVKIIAAVLMCVYMWGCGDTYYDWEDRRSSRRVVGFVDDSLVMVGDIRCWTKYEETVLAMSDEELGSGCGHTRLCVYNYRVQEDGPRWCDSLDNTRDESTLMGQMTDSIVWGGNVPESIKLWKLGEKPYERKLRKIVEGCSVVFKAKSIKQWLEGTFIVRGDKSLNMGGDSCQYAVLDTMQRTITYKKLEDDLKWIKKCDDVRTWGNDVYCLALKGNPMNLYLMKNNMYLDSLLQGEPYGWTYYTKVGFAGDMLDLGNNVCRIVNDAFLCIGVSIRSALEFSNENGNSVTY